MLQTSPASHMPPHSIPLEDDDAPLDEAEPDPLLPDPLPLDPLPLDPLLLEPPAPPTPTRA
jgi:hypothetical protein